MLPILEGIRHLPEQVCEENDSGEPPQIGHRMPSIRHLSAKEEP